MFDQTNTLTTGIDALTGTAGDDTFIGDAASTSLADQIDGGAGTDTLKLFGAAAKPSFTNIEIVELNGNTAGFDVSTDASVTTLNLIDPTTALTYTIANGVKMSISTVLAAEVVDIAGNTVTALDLTVSGFGTAASNATIDFNSTAQTSLTLNSGATTSGVEILNTGGKLDTITLTGSTAIDITSALTTVKTINASATTGGVDIEGVGASDLTFTGGTGNDTINLGATLTVADVIDGGAGTDTVIVSDAALNSATSTVGKGILALKNIEIVGSSVTAADGVTIDATKFTNVNTFQVGSGGALAPATQATAGDNAVTFTFAAGDTLSVAASVTGGETTGSATHAGDAINASALVNSGADVLNLSFAAAATVTGGASVTGSSTGNGGDGLDASSVETINISTASATADVAFVGGATVGGAAGASVSVGANATINITGAGDVNLGTIVTQGAAVDDLTINGSGMTGVLTVVSGAGNDIIKGGSAADVITGGAGIDTLTGGAGADTFIIAAAADSSATVTDMITDFVGGTDEIKFVNSATFEVVSGTTITNAASLSAATTAAFALAATANDAGLEAIQFTFDSKTFFAIEATATGDATGAVVIDVTGLTGTVLAGDFIA